MNPDNSVPQDLDRDMLVGFCMAVRKSALNEIGLLDEVNFPIGTWEDNDLCHRFRRAGLRLVLSQRAYVHHGGSQTMERMGLDMETVMRENHQAFIRKWKIDIESGFANSLAGLSASPINFNWIQKPELIFAEARELAKISKVSLCMIVKNEERVIRECLSSAEPFFSQIVVVDTGSTDATMEIIRTEFPFVDLYECDFSESFSYARNCSIGHATGEWIFVLDADDTLPIETGRAIQRLALTAPRHVGAFTADIRFVAAPGQGAVRVKHVKLFRNRPDYRYEHRIHEQILPAVRRSGLDVAPSDLYVIHSGYDTSPQGQRSKRVRDEKLLGLDLADTPENPFKLFNLGMSYFYWGEYDLAIEWLDKAIRHSLPEHSHLGPCYSLWATALIKQDKLEAAGKKLEEGLRAVPHDAELQFKFGQWLLESNQFAKARDAFSAALQIDITGQFTSMDYGIQGFKSMCQLGRAELGLGNYQQAKEWWLKAIGLEPHDLASIDLLTHASIEARDYSVTEHVINHLFAVEGPIQHWAALAGDYQIARLGPHADLQFLTSFVADNAQVLPVRFELAQRLIKCNFRNDAVQHLTFLAEKGVVPAIRELVRLSEEGGDADAQAFWSARLSASE